MNYLELKKSQTLFLSAKEGASIDQVLSEVRLLIACTNSMVVVYMKGFEMHIDQETDYTMLVEDYSHWEEAIKKMDEMAPKAVEAGKTLRKVLVNHKPSNLKELKTFCEKMREDLEDVPDDTPLEKEHKFIEFNNGSIMKLGKALKENVLAIGYMKAKHSKIYKNTKK